jgi:hypothetical protein
MIDINQLAQGLTSFLAPLIPYLTIAGNKIAEDVGSATWEQAQKIWGKLHPKIVSKPAANEAIQDVAANPQDANAISALQWQLKKLLTDDPNLAKDLQTLYTEGLEAGVIQNISGNNNVVAGRDLLHNVGFYQPNLSAGGEVIQSQGDINIEKHSEDPKQH